MERHRAQNDQDGITILGTALPLRGQRSLADTGSGDSRSGRDAGARRSEAGCGSPAEAVSIIRPLRAAAYVGDDGGTFRSGRSIAAGRAGDSTTADATTTGEDAAAVSPGKDGQAASLATDRHDVSILTIEGADKQHVVLRGTLAVGTAPPVSGLLMMSAPLLPPPGRYR
jgi:hypothetical protein